MSDSKVQSGASRRHALKLLGAAPMLPLGGLAFLTACGGGGGGGTSFPIIPPAPAPSPAPAPAPAVNFVSAEFTGMAAPTLANAPAMATTTVGSTLKVSFDNGSSTEYKLAYQPFFLTGDMVSDGKGGKILAGGYVDINNKPIIDASVAGKERQFFSDSPDGTSLLSLPNANVAGVKGKPVFAVVQFEYNTRDQSGADTYGVLPSPIAVLTLDQDQTTGKLSLVKYHNVDMSSAHGLWITCGASLSPWNTHLSSEEYEPDAFAAVGSSADKQFKAYSKNVFGDETTANVYHYGHLPEVTVNPDGTGSVKKHYCMGRISHELIQVMPDQRTAIMGDDYTNGGFFMFVADKEKDLSAGTLYVARYDAGYSIDPAAAPTKITWIKLGHATSAEIENLANTLKPLDIMDVKTADPGDASYTKLFANGAANWVKLKPGMEKAAAYLETHRYANLKGASMAFTKMEGTTVNIKDKVAYSALQNIQDSMVSGGKGWSAATNIALPKKLSAGGVMAHNLGGGQKDADGTAINSEWVPTQTRALIVGKDLDTPDALGNTSSPDTIGNPDNLKFSEKMRTLFIGEDSSSHVNNFLWAYNIDTKKLARIMSIPAGGESTGLHAVDEINGWTYIMSNFQHPGDWGGIHSLVQPTLDPLVRANYKDRFSAAVGYLTADPIQLKLSK
ncbi:secreted PhoX family phosphatase [Variovorax boronicumulans]|uniref:PhoX family protein n=1 Tax=Variovorax boronicumulans TaxID=436515 RepID=UPI00278A8E76|nr:alkaline phosphatase PhoX [Variovorax boronicumulans]MDQ0015025.1 secreted PhoX family phosphatase [Variovorax boronicumulans]